MRMRRRFVAVVMAVAAWTAVAGAGAASAHPLGNFTVNRYTEITLAPGVVRVLHVVDMAEIPTQQERPDLDTDGDGDIEDAEAAAWAEREAPALLRGLALSVDGRRLMLRVRTATATLLDGQAGLPTLRLEVRAEAAVPPSGRGVLTETNDVDRAGWREIVVTSVDGVAVTASEVPRTSVSRGLRSYPEDMLSSPLDVRRATFVFEPGGASPGSDDPAGATGGGGDATGGFAALATWRIGPALLLAALGLAFLFGVLHALGPGHGKTIMAAYLVGTGARLRQAAAVGVAVSLMHTLSVLGLGLVAVVLFRSFPAETVYPWLGLATGAVVLALGTALLARRVRGGSAHHPHDHTHPHDHAHPHEGADAPRPLSRKGLVALALSGGILPSPTALVVLTATAAAGRVAYGVALIIAFSLGLATALTVVGSVAVRARAFAVARLGGRWNRAIQVGAAAAVVGVGGFLAVRSATQLV